MVNNHSREEERIAKLDHSGAKFDAVVAKASSQQPAAVYKEIDYSFSADGQYREDDKNYRPFQRVSSEGPPEH